MNTTWRNRLWLSCLTLMGLLTAPAARAQYSPDLIMENYNGATWALTSSMINKKMIDDAVKRSNGKSSKTNATVKAAVPKINLAYTPTAALQQQTVQNLVSKMQAQNPEAAQTAGKALGSGQTSYHKLFAQMMSDSDLPTNNAATALGAYLGLGYMIINNMQNGTTPAMDKGLQRQAAGILAKNPRLTSPTAVAQLGEEMKLQVVVLYLGWQSALKSPDQLQPFQASVAQSFANMGLDLRQVKLTENGLVKKS